MILLQQLHWFFLSLEWGDLAKRWCSSPLKTLRGRQYSIKQHTQFTMLNKVLDALASNIKDSLIQAHCIFHSLVWVDYEQRWCSSLMKTLRGRQYSFKQLTEFTILTKFLDRLVSNIKDSLQKLQVSLKSLEWGYFAKRWWLSPMKSLRGRQYSFKLLTEFTMLYKLPALLAYNINYSLTRATVLLLFTWMWWFCKKVMTFTHEITER
jgi:hypothetical protein